jgi:hypothetical protein
MQSYIGCFRYETVHSTSWRACKPEKVLLNLVATKCSVYVEDFFFFFWKTLRPAVWPTQSPAQWVIDEEGWSFLWVKRPWREATTHFHRLPRRSMSRAITSVPCITSWPVQRKIYFCLPSNDVPINQLTLHGVTLTFIYLEYTELCLNIYRISETSGIW